MNAILLKIFKNKRAVYEKLLNYGFILSGGKYIYKALVCGGEMELNVSVDNSREISADVIDLKTQDTYTLHLIESATGSFVGGIRAEYESILNDISDNCFEREAFKSDFAKQVINYARNKYNGELEFLWEKFDNNAVLRRNDNNKWYAVLLTVSKRKLGLDSDEVAEIIDLRIDTGSIDGVIDNKRYFGGYHMNKRHWITACLDGSVGLEEIFSRLNDSYNLALK